MAKSTAKKSKKSGTTPLMAQYFQVKAQHPDALLLFRVGDFYETFAEDAVKASKALGITLTSRNNGGSDVELAGFPHHAMDVYMPRLVRAGFRVAICEQMEKPVPGKVVRRAVTEVVTPGVTTDDALLNHNQNNFLATVCYGKNEQFGIAFLDISTGEFFVSEGNTGTIDKLLQSFRPSEVIIPKSRMREFNAGFGDRFYVNTLEDWIFTLDFGREKLLQHFQTKSLKGFGIEEMELSQSAAGAALQYLSTTENTRLQHIAGLSRLQTNEYVWLDRFTIRNLELVYPNNENGSSLLHVIDHTLSPMGARMLKKWVLLPLTSLKQIQDRQDIVTQFIESEEKTERLQPHVKKIGDLERLMAKTAVGKINPREARHLWQSLLAIDELKKYLESDKHDGLKKIGEGLNPCNTLREKIQNTLVEDPPTDVRKGGAIAGGAHAELDELRSIALNSKDHLEQIRVRESERTGITNLKIGNNSVFGYFLEVTNKFKDHAPEEWIRKQTTANAERYITEELKQLEARIVGAEEKMLELEMQIFSELIEEIGTYIRPNQHNAFLIAQIDCLLSLAKVAVKNNYCKPQLDDSTTLDITEGRHPVIETQLPVGEAYIPNSVLLDTESTQIILITGPNMAGKSALLRQTALIVLLAQIGSYVPAQAAHIGIVDKVFTRVGASDNISGGESTFMVEMNETALIMNNISSRSLILLDEIGRGTSTYDGISIAWSIVEYLHNNERAHPKTLFATHYHELNELSERHERVHNFHVSTKEHGQKVIFLRKLKPGGTNHSFGIHVARMAGMPQSIVERANAILEQLETKHIEEDVPATEKGKQPRSQDARNKVKNLSAPMQLQIFEADEYTRQIKKELIDLDLNTMTPMDALWKLNELRKIAEKK
jgi:DNA mismatch repair protein MutS